MPWVVEAFASTAHRSRGPSRYVWHAGCSSRSCFGNLFDPSNSLFIHI